MKSLLTVWLSLILLTSACKKDEVVTEGEKIAQQIQTILNANPTIKKATFYQANTLIEENQTFTLSGQYMLTGSNTYNLGQLVRYQAIPYQQIILLYF